MCIQRRQWRIFGTDKVSEWVDDDDNNSVPVPHKSAKGTHPPLETFLFLLTLSSAIIIIIAVGGRDIIIKPQREIDIPPESRLSKARPNS